MTHRYVPQRGVNLDYLMWVFTRVSGLALILLAAREVFELPVLALRFVDGSVIELNVADHREGPDLDEGLTRIAREHQCPIENCECAKPIGEPEKHPPRCLDAGQKDSLTGVFQHGTSGLEARRCGRVKQCRARPGPDPLHQGRAYRIGGARKRFQELVGCKHLGRPGIAEPRETEVDEQLPCQFWIAIPAGACAPSGPAAPRPPRPPPAAAPAPAPPSRWSATAGSRLGVTTRGDRLLVSAGVGHGTASIGERPPPFQEIAAIILLKKADSCGSAFCIEIIPIISGILFYSHQTFNMIYSNLGRAKPG